MSINFRPIYQEKSLSLNFSWFRFIKEGGKYVLVKKSFLRELFIGGGVLLILTILLYFINAKNVIFLFYIVMGGNFKSLN